MSELGGFIKMLRIILGIFPMFWNKKSAEKLIIDQLYKIDTQSENKFKV